MSSLLSKTWAPVAAVTAVALQVMAPHPEASEARHIMAAVETIAPNDTVVYPIDGYKRGWTEDEKTGKLFIADSLLTGDGGFGELGVDDDGRPAALDTLIAPDSLALTDTFRFKYFAALRDSLSHMYIRDSLIAAGDSLEWPILDSLYAVDSAIAWQLEFDKWYASLDKTERKKYDMEQLSKVKLAQMDSLKAVKDSIQAYKDSVLEATPRILDSYVFRDSLQFRRLLSWTHDRDFGNVTLRDEDTSFNYRFHENPFQRNDVGGIWTGLPGSSVLEYDITRRGHDSDASFFDPYSSWTYTPETFPMYNTKTPYTELCYSGTLFSGSSKAVDNLHLLTSQNITPAFNFTLLYDRFGGDGTIAHEATANKTTAAAINYTGPRYLMHAGYIHDKITREESGGILDNFWIRDTTVDAREIEVALTDASSTTVKNTLFLDQQYRIPFTFIEKWRERRAAKAAGLQDSMPAALPDAADSTLVDSTAVEGQAIADSLMAHTPEEAESQEVASAEESPEAEEKPVTTAFIGHSSEYTVFRRTYQDAISSTAGQELYGNSFYLNPTTSADSMRVSRLDNRVYLRLQPWSDTSIVSKLDVGAGYKLLNYYNFEPGYLKNSGNETWNSGYLYAGVKGQYRKYINWDARGHLTMFGHEAGDFDFEANAKFNFYPFRKFRNSPVSLGAHFETALEEPDWYSSHMHTNHYNWDLSLDKISTTRIQGNFSIPHWRMDGAVTWTLLAGQLYHDASSIMQQNTEAMSVLTARLRKDFVAGPLHLDNRILFQASSNTDVLPLPKIAANARWYMQFVIAKVLTMQIGADAWYTDSWYMPGWNPALGAFYNQQTEKYGNAPVLDAFINMQWKRACIFVKLENAGMGWPLERADYFTAHHYVRTQRGLRVGVFWPFYTMPAKKGSSSSGSALSGTGGMSSVSR